MAVHLGAFAGHIFPFAHIIVPLIVWMLKKDASSFVNDQGKESVNAQLTFTLYCIPCALLWLVFIGIPLTFGLYVANCILVIVAAMAANEGRTYRYPLILRLVK